MTHWVPRIRCAICDKPVEKVEWWEEAHSREWVIRATCHGDTDRMSFVIAAESEAMLEQIKTGEGMAFTTKRIKEQGNV